MRQALLMALVAAGWTAFQAYRKGYNPLLWFLPGAGVIGLLLMLLVMPDLRPSVRGADRNARLRHRGNIVGGSLSGIGLLALVFQLGVVGWLSGNRGRAVAPSAEIVVRLADDRDAPGLEPVRLPYSMTGDSAVETLYLYPKVEFDSRDVATLSTVKDQYGRDALEIALRRDGSERLAELTRTHIGKRLAIFVDGQIESAPVITGTVTDGRLRVPRGQ